MKKLVLFSVLTLLLCGVFTVVKPGKAYAASKKTSAGKNGICSDVIVPNQEAEEADDSEEAVKTKDTGYYVKRIIGAAIVGLIIALITIGIMKSGMNNVTKARSAENYVVKDSFKVTKTNDRYISTKISREKKTN